MIHEHCRATSAHDAAFDLSDLLNASLQGGDIQDFDTRWDQALLSASEVPKEYVLECLYEMRLRELAWPTRPSPCNSKQRADHGEGAPAHTGANRVPISAWQCG